MIRRRFAKQCLHVKICFVFWKICGIIYTNIMKNGKLIILNSIFNQYPEIGLVYLFGSRVRGDVGPLSDYDFAVYFENADKKRMFEIKFSLQAKLSRSLKTDNVDVVLLNIAGSPELKYNIIKEGKIIFEKKESRITVEPKILNEYFDFHAILSKHNLTKAQ